MGTVLQLISSIKNPNSVLRTCFDEWLVQSTAISEIPKYFEHTKNHV